MRLKSTNISILNQCILHLLSLVLLINQEALVIANEWIKLLWKIKKQCVIQTVCVSNQSLYSCSDCNHRANFINIADHWLLFATKKSTRLVFTAPYTLSLLHKNYLRRFVVHDKYNIIQRQCFFVAPPIAFVMIH